MAVITKPFGIHAGGQARVDIRYNDANLRILAAIPVNNTQGTLWVRLSTLDGTTIVEQSFPPGSTERLLNAGEAQQLGIFINAKGGVDGINIETGWTPPLG